MEPYIIISTVILTFALAGIIFGGIGLTYAIDFISRRGRESSPDWILRDLHNYNILFIISVFVFLICLNIVITAPN